MGMNTNLYQHSLALSEESKKAGYHEGRLSTVKYQSRELWKYLKDKEKPLSEAYVEYIDETIEARNKLIEIFYELKENRNLKKFSRFAFSLKESKKEFYKTPVSLYNTMNSIFNITTIQTPYKTFLRHKKIIKMYEQYKKETA
jgi:predicted methyltransferase MtxX (methanogen marker protein 4)